ncbi:sugar ABC transporter substrate-binding protein [Peptostreptococcus russellii]|uniref:Sugar ABC transporter substrate-binding protein n=1 Tax=Peptostreptococcus russellii TaxID=215200 RepID=A0A2P7PYH6_9FIRM|nr:ABC transporter substrate-binding protein [Peptostreptococcus russellii]PSJ30767.1 sugar ABC transporter substrate-binding protein [Peptostreptococcus russellii]
MKKKFLAIALCCTMLATTLAGCGSEKAKDDSKESTKTEMLATKVNKDTEITFWHAMSGVNEEAIQKITDDFMKQNPNVKVKLVNQGGYLDLFDKLMAAAKAKQLPTMTQVYSNRLSWYVSKDLVTDLNPYMNDKETGMTEEEKKDIPKIFLDDGIWDNKQYALPLNKSQMVLYYNEGMLKEKGIEVPKTWEEWKKASKELTVDENKDGDPEVYGTVFANNLSTDIAPWVVQSGGSTMDEETNELHFNSEPMKEAVGFLDSMFKEKTARFAGDDQNANVPLQDGRAAMCIASTSALPYIEEGTADGIKINAAPLPGNKNDAQLYYGTNIAIFNTASKLEQQAAWEYLHFLTNSENTAYFAAETGYIPVRTSAKDDPVFKKVLDEKPIKKLSFDSFDKGFQGTRNIGGINALDELGKQIDLVFHGEKDIDKALDDAQKNGTKAMEDAKNN